MAYRDLCHPAAKEAVFRNLKITQTFTDAAVDYLQKLMFILESTAREVKQLTKTHRRKAQEQQQQYLTGQFGLCYLPEWVALLKEIEEVTVDMQRSFGGQALDDMVTNIRDASSARRGLVKQVYSWRDRFDRDVKKAEEEVTSQHGKLVSAFRNHASKKNDKALRNVYHNEHNDYIIAMTGYNGLAQGAICNDIPGIMEDVEDVIVTMLSSLSNRLQDAFGVIQSRWGAMNESIAKFKCSMSGKNIKADMALFVQCEKKQHGEYLFPIVKYSPPQAKTPCTALDEKLERNDMTLAALARVKGQNILERCKLGEKVMQLQGEIKDILKCRVEQINKDSSISGQIITTEERLYLTKYELRHSQFCLNRIETSLNLFDEDDDTYIPGSCQDSTKLGSHMFIEQTYKTPTFCRYCKKLLVGLIKQGVQCSQCKINVHRNCRAKVPYCPQATVSREHYLPSTDTVKKKYCDTVTNASNILKISDSQHSNKRESSTDLQSSPLPSSFSRSSDADSLQLAPEQYRRRTNSCNVACPPLPSRGTRLSDTATSEPVPQQFRKRSVSFDMPRPPLPSQGASSSLPTSAHHYHSRPLPEPAGGVSTPHSTMQKTSNSENVCSRMSDVLSGRRKKIAIALYDYQAETPEDLPITKGCRIEVVKEDDQWTTGIWNGRTGMFPKIFGRTLKPGERVYCAVYDFAAENSDELSAEKGDLLLSDKQEEAGWLCGTSLASDKSGIFPLVYVKEI